MGTRFVLVLAGAGLAAVLPGWGGPVQGQGGGSCGPAWGAAVAGATYTASATVTPGDGGEVARLSLTVLDDDYSPLDSGDDEQELGATAVTLSATVVAPAGAATYQAAVMVVGGGECGGISVVQTAPPPPTPAPTPRPTPPNPAPAPAGTVAPAAPSIGPELSTGGFEQVSRQGAAGWEQRGGELVVAGLAFAGERAAVLASSTRGTKWLQQAVTVQGGEWYEASARARIVSGEGQAFLRIAWYASGDGSGRQLSTVTGERAGSGEWGRVTVGPGQAPPEARSAVLRLMLQPQSAARVVAAFDEASFGIGEAPTPTATPTPTPTPTPAPIPTATPTADATPSPTPAATPAPTAVPTATPSREPVSRSTPTATAARPAPTSAAAGPPALRLSEVLADPVEPGVDGAYEWVELVNTATVAVSTAGWAIGDATSVDPLPAVEVPPGGFVVVAAKTAVLPVNVLVARAPDGTIGNGLNNAGDVVRLISPAGDVVDALSFGENRSVLDSPPPVASPGATLGARFSGGPEVPGRWAETLRPSPGAPNTFAEPEATPAPRPTPSASPAAAPTPAAAATEVAATPVPLPVRFERESGSRTPWIALGAVAGASLVLTFAAAHGAWGRWRRGG